MSKYCMIETAFNNKEEINETINVLLSKRLVASTILLKATVAGIGKMKEKVIKSFYYKLKQK